MVDLTSFPINGPIREKGYWKVDEWRRVPTKETMQELQRATLTLKTGTTSQRYTYWLLQTIQTKHIFLCVWAERVVLGSAKTALKFKYEI